MATEINAQFQLAAQYVQFTNECIFLTGKAGTGKTTFLKYIKENNTKNMAVVAPTGVAAINAGGVTMHSFFNLPFSPFIPSTIRGEFDLRTVHQEDKKAVDRHHLLGKIKINKEKKLLLQQLDVLIIDEVSMVRADTLDAIDTILKHIRSNQNAFGGVQVILIGDMFQLPPVVPNEEWTLLQQFYATPFFFSSKVVEQKPMVYIELEKIYRQTDTTFIELLNGVRNNQLSAAHNQILQQLYQPSIPIAAYNEYIILTTHNHKAQLINQQQLESLPAEMFHFKADIEGEFSNKAFPADELLQLKLGSKVMFIKNDTEKVRRYFNGKIGTVINIIENEIEISCHGETETIKVGKEKWENIQYNLNQSNQQIEEKVIGSFTQYPIRLAWAITIHKSQGLTFNKAIIDAGIAFAPGQVYVALSRCTSLEGIILQSPINANSLKSDDRIITFTKTKANIHTLQSNLAFAQQVYTEQLVYELFNVQPYKTIITEAEELLIAEAKKCGNNAHLTFMHWCNPLLNLLPVQERFYKELKQLYNTQNNPQLFTRLHKAATYFTQQLNNVFIQIETLAISTESRMLAQEINAIIKNLHHKIYAQTILFTTITENGFNINTYYSLKANLQIPNCNFNAYANVKNKGYSVTTNHPILYQQLVDYRNELCNANSLPLYFVASAQTLEELANYLPQTPTDLLQITGFGKIKIDKYGDGFLHLIQAYCQQNGLSTAIHTKVNSIATSTKNKKPKLEKGNSIATTLALFKQGKSLEAIAEERLLSSSTIFGHAIKLIKEKQLLLSAVLSVEKEQQLQAMLHNTTVFASLTAIKDFVGDNFSFNEIRCYISYHELDIIAKKQPD